MLLFSDLHLDRAYEWAPPGIGEARRAAAREALIAILGDARRQGVDAIACAGDLFNRRTVSPANMQWLAAAFRSASVPVLIAPGNDDFIGPLGGYTSHDWPENVTVFDSDRFSPVDVDGVTIWGAAHTAAHRSRSFLDGFEVDGRGVNIALFHGAETSGKLREPGADPCAEFDEADLERAGFEHALVGHYQQPHFGRLYTYPGAPIAHAFGPGATGGVVVVTLRHDGSFERDFIPVPSPEMHDVDVDVTGAKSKADVLLQTKGVVAGRSGVIRLSLMGRLSAGIVLTRGDLASLTSSPDNLLIRWNVKVDVDIDDYTEEPTIRGQFLRDLISGDVSNERRDRVLLIGLRALAGHDELEGPR